MKKTTFTTQNLKDITAAALAASMRTSNPAYIAFIGDSAVLITAEGDFDADATYTTDDESGLPAERLAIRAVAAFAQPKDVSGKSVCPVQIGYRNVGQMDDEATFRLIGAAAAKLLEDVNSTGRGLFQRKIDSAQDPHTTVACYVMNGGGNYKVQPANVFAGFNEVTAIDVAMGNDAERHEVVFGGKDANNKPAITRLSPYTGQELPASSTSVRIQIPIEVADIESIAIDRDTRTVTFVGKTDERNKAYASKLGTSRIEAISEFDGAETVRMKNTGLYAFKADGTVVFSKRRVDGKLDLGKTEIVLSGIDAGSQRLHDVKVTEKQGGGNDVVAILAGRRTQTTGARTWTTQSLQGSAAA